jgi:hypothetical protein
MRHWENARSAEPSVPGGHASNLQQEGWRGIWPPDVLFTGNRGESGATWPDKDDKDENKNHPL